MATRLFQCCLVCLSGGSLVLAIPQSSAASKVIHFTTSSKIYLIYGNVLQQVSKTTRAEVELDESKAELQCIIPDSQGAIIVPFKPPTLEPSYLQNLISDFIMNYSSFLWIAAASPRLFSVRNPNSSDSLFNVLDPAR